MINPNSFEAVELCAREAIQAFRANGIMPPEPTRWLESQRCFGVEADRKMLRMLKAELAYQEAAAALDRAIDEAKA